MVALYGEVRMWGQMTREDLVEQKTMVLDAINLDVTQRRQQAGLPLTVEEQKETSMLKGHEASESLRIYEALRKQYQQVIQRKGGIEPVIKELEDYIIALLGNDETYRTNQQKRKHNPRDPLNIQQLKAALRVLNDEAPNSHFGNFLHPGATGHIGLDFERGEPNGREVLAHFWLAASDPLMQLDTVDEPNREQCIREEKMVVIAQLFDIRRSHNDGQYTPVDDEKDDPSCAPGTWGRIAKMHVHNKLTKMHEIESPATKFKSHMTPFFIEKFSSLDLTSQMEMINAMNDSLINREKYPSNAPVTTLDNFILNLRLSEVEEMAYFLKMIEEYGQFDPSTRHKVLDVNHQRFAVLTYHEELLNIQEQINNDLFVRLQGIMIQRLVESVSAIVKKNLNQHPQVKLALNNLNQIEYRIRSLQKQLQQLESKIKQINYNKPKAERELAKIKKEKGAIENAFISLSLNRATNQKMIDETAREQLALEIKKIMTLKMTIKPEQINEFIAQLSPILKVVKAEVVQEVGAPLSPEVANITLAQIKQSPNYVFLLKSLKNENRVLERMVKNLIVSKSPDLELSRVNELIKEWMEYQEAHPQTEPVQTIATIPESPVLNEENSYALGLYFYNAAKSIGEARTTVRKAEYEEYIKKAVACGVRCELALDPAVVKEQGIDKANINPGWLVRIRANLEEAEEGFILTEASVNKVFAEFRYLNMVNQFNHFTQGVGLVELNKNVAALTAKADRYFDELAKELPNQGLLAEHYYNMQNAQKLVIKQLEEMLVAFSQYWTAQGNSFYQEDKEYLYSIITDSKKMERKILPELQEHFKMANEKLAQLELLSFSHDYYQETMNSIKNDIMRLVADFQKSMDDYEADLQARNPKKGSIAFKQLQALQRAKAKLLLDKTAFNAELNVHHLAGLDINQFHLFAQRAVGTANSLQAELQEIGQASGFQKSIKAFKNQARSIVNKPVKMSKELTAAEIQVMKVSLDDEKIRKQKESIEEVKTLVKRYDHKRQPLLMKSFEETRRQEQLIIPILTSDEAQLALDYIHLNANKPDSVNLQGYLKEGVVVSIIDSHKDPMQLQFDDPASNKPPKRTAVPVSLLKDYADRLRRKIEQRETLKYAPAYEMFGILFREYQSFGEVGQENGRPERIAFVEKLQALFEMDPQLLPLALMSQTREGLSALSLTLLNSNKPDLLTQVQKVVAKKVTDFNELEKIALDNGQPLPNHNRWERTTAQSNQTLLAEALVQKLELTASSKQKM